MKRFAGALLLAACSVFAQLPPAQAPTPALSSPRRAGASLVEIETVVTDAAGRIAPDLAAADFTLDSVRKFRIESCVYVDTREHRTLVFLVDDLALNGLVLGQVRTAIEAFVAGRLKAGGRLAILRTGDGEGTFQQLTGDKEALGRAIARMVYNPRNAFTKGPSGATFATGALGSLRVAIEGLRRLTGRKSVVLISPGLHDQPVRDLQNLSAAARRAEVSVYGIDPVAEPATPAENSAPSAGAAPLALTNFALAHLDSASGMAGLARQTGGELMAGKGSLDRALAHVVEGPDGYYRVGFQDQDLWDPARLKVTRPGYALLASRQVTDSGSDLQGPGVPRQTEDDLGRLLYDPFSADGIDVRLTPLFSNTAEGPVIQALVYLDVRQLVFRRNLDGLYHGHIELLVAALGAGAQPVRHTAQAIDLNWSEDQYRDSLRGGAVLPLKLAVPSGGLEIRAVVRDGASGRFGCAHQWLEVPALSDGRLALSGMVLEAPDRVPGQDREQGPGRRIFQTGQAIEYRCDLYNLIPASQASQKEARIQLQLTLFRPNGEVVVERPLQIAFQPSGTGKTPEAVGRMMFPPGSAPGRYHVQVTVSDMSAPGVASRTAVQFSDFELRP